MTQRLMNRRAWLLGAMATGGLVRAGVASAAPFASRRIAVTVRGTGRDVLLIPGLASGPGIWNGVLAALPGWRRRPMQVAMLSSSRSPTKLRAMPVRRD